jgi:hypothetical protein
VNSWLPSPVILLTGAIGAVLYQLAGRPPTEAGPITAGHRVTRLPGGVWLCDEKGCHFASYFPAPARRHKIQTGGVPASPEAMEPHADVRPVTTLPTGSTPVMSSPPAPLAPSPSPSLAEWKTCPDCAESVRAAARKCRFCGYQFDVQVGAPSSAPWD